MAKSTSEALEGTLPGEGMLFMVPTPIGNLEDITLRALNTLKTCDLILAEDTRHSGILLKHYGIQKPLLSYHKFNESARQEQILGRLAEGQQLALISDAGTLGSVIRANALFGR